jgi:heptosyltransferase-2
MGRLADALSSSGAQLVLISNSAGCALYQSDQRFLNRVVVKKESGIRKAKSIFRIAKQIRKENLDVLLVAHESFTSHLIASLSRVPRTLAFRGPLARLFRFEENVVPSSCHTSAKYLALARLLVSDDAMKSSRLSLQGDASLIRFRSKYSDLIDAHDQPFFICSPGSVWQTKKYPPELLSRVLIRLLSELPSHRCVLSGGPGDFETIDRVKEGLKEQGLCGGDENRVLDARDCLPLAELVELTRRADFVICPDSAPLHIASATGTKVFAFFGPTSAQTGFGPLNENGHVLDQFALYGLQLDCQPCTKHGGRVCPLAHHRCLTGLDPDAVASHVLRLLSVAETFVR